VVDFAIRYKDFTGGDWGDQDPAKAQPNQFSGTNVDVYGSGLLGVRPGWKLLDLTGKIANPPATYTGIVRGFDVMGNKLTIALDTKTYDVWWDLSLAPNGTLPNVQPANLPAALAAGANVQFLYGADSAVKEMCVVDGKFCLKSATPSWDSQTIPAAFSVMTRWGLWLVAVDRAQPWKIWYSNVDASGPNFLSWPANNFLFVGTTETITTLLAIFNLLYAGRRSGWWGISGVLGTQASVRELAIGNGPVDQRAATVTTDARVAYWPLQSVPAFWNGARVQLVDDQRMDPRQIFVSLASAFARSASPDPGRSYITCPPGWTDFAFDVSLRQTGTVWASAVGNPTRGTARVQRRQNTNTNIAPGWNAVPFPNLDAADVGWTAAADGSWVSPTVTGSYLIEALVGSAGGGSPMPNGTVIAIVVDGVEKARLTVQVPSGGSTQLALPAQLTINAGQHVGAQVFNASGATFMITANAAPGNPTMAFRVWDAVAPAATGRRWVCPTTGGWDIHAEVTINIPIFLTVNGNVVATGIGGNGGNPPATIDLPNYQLQAGDTVSVLLYSFGASSRFPTAATGPEGVATPFLRIGLHDQGSSAQLLVPGDAVVVTPTERRILMVGAEGSTTKVWQYKGSAWTHHAVPMLVGGIAPADVKAGYVLPEHVVFATKASYTAEPLKVWSVMHDIDRPALASDQWASPWDQNMPAGPGVFADVLVKGQASLAAWFDSQGRQVRVRSVIVQFVKWDQGIAGGVNQISARVDSIGPYDRGVTTGTEATWTGSMTAATPDGVEDSWRFNVGEQGFGNGFQVVFTALYGVAIREVVALVDIRTERT
jgi:hypothetical protein